MNAVTFADSSSKILFSGGDDGICKVIYFYGFCLSRNSVVIFAVAHEQYGRGL